jgi:hypothetical protein
MMATSSRYPTKYMARKRVRELPEKIEKLEKRITGLGEDIATSGRDNRIIIGGWLRTKDEIQEALAAQLKGVSMTVWHPERIPLGTYHGLKFGLDLSPRENPSVCVEGAVTRFLELSRDNPGPRAIMNAVARLVDGHADERRWAAKDLDIAREQLRDYQTRIGSMFSHEVHLEELHTLRDQLEQALSDKPKEGLPTQEKIVARIKALRETHTAEAAPERAKRQASMEEAVTTRILRNREQAPEPEQIEILVQEKPVEIMTFRKPIVTKPKATYREKVEGEKKQISLF